MTSTWSNSDSPMTGPCQRSRRIRMAPLATDTLTWCLGTCIWVGAGLTGVHLAHAEGTSGPKADADGAAPSSDRERDTTAGAPQGRTTAGTVEKRPHTTSASPQRTGEPSVDVVCKAAVALALAEPERARAFLGRARLAGWLPEIHFRIYRRFARTEGLTFADMGSGTVAPVDISAVDDVRYEWRGSWDLSRMVFNPDELQAHFEALRMADVRRDIQSLVIKLYFERLRLLADAAPDRSTGGSPTAISPSGAPVADKLALRVSEIEAELDALSGGAFSAGVSAALSSGHARAAASP